RDAGAGGSRVAAAERVPEERPSRAALAQMAKNRLLNLRFPHGPLLGLARLLLGASSCRTTLPIEPALSLQNPEAGEFRRLIRLPQAHQSLPEGLPAAAERGEAVAVAAAAANAVAPVVNALLRQRDAARIDDVAATGRARLAAVANIRGWIALALLGADDLRRI